MHEHEPFANFPYYRRIGLHRIRHRVSPPSEEHAEESGRPAPVCSWHHRASRHVWRLRTRAGCIFRNRSGKARMESACIAGANTGTRCTCGISAGRNPERPSPWVVDDGAVRCGILGGGAGSRCVGQKTCGLAGRDWFVFQHVFRQPLCSVTSIVHHSFTSLN